jgi:hypothetical protein
MNMKGYAMQTDTAVHPNPVWRDRANFLIKARLPVLQSQDVPSKEWEQIWCRQIAENQFEVCCIPFFLYDLALGDVVETGLEGENRYVVQRVVNPSGRCCFRVWFGKSSTPDSRDEVIEFANQLFQREQDGSLMYETGRSS